MNALLVLAAVALAVFAVSRVTREHLPATDRIKVTNSAAGPDPTEARRIAAMAPPSMIATPLIQQSATAARPAEVVLGGVLHFVFVAPFFENVYGGATAPITEADIDKFLVERRPPSSGRPDQAWVTSQFDNGNAKAFLKAFFIDQAAPVPVPGPRATTPSPPPPPPPPPRAAPPPAVIAPPPPPPPIFVPPTASSDFNSVLARYQAALLDSKTTGSLSSQTQAAALKAWLDAKLAETQTQTTTRASGIQSFLQEYANSTSEIEGVRKKFQEVRARGPVLQDVYETDTRVRAAEGPTYDVTPLYYKVAIAGGLTALGVVIWRRL